MCYIVDDVKKFFELFLEHLLTAILDGRESQWTPGVGDGQGGLACCASWDRKELDTTERLIWSDLIWCYKGVLFSVVTELDVQNVIVFKFQYKYHLEL